MDRYVDPRLVEIAKKSYLEHLQREKEAQVNRERALYEKAKKYLKGGNKR